MKTSIMSIAVIAAVLFVSGAFMEARSQEGSVFTVARFLVCEDVVDREPVGATNSFGTDTEKAFAFLEARDVAEDTTVQLAWYYQDDLMNRTELRLGAGPRWRTFAWKTLFGLKGQWRVELQDMDGVVIDSVSFTVA